MRYAIWNNKGGVGKSFLTFVIGTEYAKTHPEENVVIMDLCPQANVSEIILGGDGTGSQNLDQLLAENNRRTIGGYFDERIESPQRFDSRGISRYSIGNLRSFNRHLPTNLRFVAGDPSLEVQTQTVNQLSNLSLPAESWRNIHSWVLDLVRGIEQILGEDTVTFIDCNPSFSAYTELAILAAERLIVPCTADGSSARGIDNISRLVYGANIPERYRGVNFNQKAVEFGFHLPKIHVICLNRSTQFDRRPATAFAQMLEQVKARANQLDDSFFTQSRAHRFLDIPDMHTPSVVCTDQGLPLSELAAGFYDIHGANVELNPDQIEKYNDAIGNLIELL